jgi:hypothetical protein
VTGWLWQGVDPDDRASASACADGSQARKRSAWLDVPAQHGAWFVVVRDQAIGRHTLLSGTVTKEAGCAYHAVSFGNSFETHETPFPPSGSTVTVRPLEGMLSPPRVDWSTGTLTISLAWPALGGQPARAKATHVFGRSGNATASTRAYHGDRRSTSLK